MTKLQRAVKHAALIGSFAGKYGGQVVPWGNSVVAVRGLRTREEAADVVFCVQYYIKDSSATPRIETTTGLWYVDISYPL